MFKQLFKFTAALLFSTFLWVSGVMASGKMEVPLGQEVILEADALVSGQDYKWVVTKEDEIIETQEGNVFAYRFNEQGEYEVNVSATDPLVETRYTTVSIMVGGRYSKPSDGVTDVFDVPLKVTFSTLPKVGADGMVHVLGEEGRVAFDILPRVDVLEYRIDKNVFVDSDGNGIPNDDIDNLNDRSYLLGGLWQTTYAASDSNEIRAEITLVNAAGNTAKGQVQIVFDPFEGGTGEPLAILDTLPPTSSDDNKIYVYGQEDTVAFYARRSQGAILEYRIDNNIFEDADGDGDPANDIDNLNDDSFKTGDVWTANYQKSDQKIIAQLIVVGQGNVGSKIEREVVFIEGPVTDLPTESKGIVLTADKEFVQLGDPINYTVQGLSQELENYSFEWDFNGDNEIDQITEGVNTVTYIFDTPGIQKVSVMVQDKDGNKAPFTKEIEVKGIQATNANFEFEVDGLTVDFKNLSTVAASLSNQTLAYQWSFGDPVEENYIAQQDQETLENPAYTYTKPGTYSVTLMVTDTEGTTDSKTLEVTVGGGAQEGVAEEEAGTQQESEGSLVGTIFKVILYIVLAIVVLVLLAVIGMLIYLKIKHPDLVFEELIDELKIKILSLLGVHDVIEPDQPSTPGITGGTIPPYKPKQQSAPPKPAEPVSVPSKPEPKPEPTPDLSKQNAPMPEWLKPKEDVPKTPSTTPPSPPSQKPVIEGEVVEKPAPPPTEKPNVPPPPSQTQKPGDQKDLSKSDGPVPDWLKDA